MPTPAEPKEIETYFEYSSQGVDVVQDGLKEMTFGEFLVDQSVISRAQLFAALQLQDKNPGVRLGECLSALGCLPYPEVEHHIGTWKLLAVVEI